MCASKVPSNPMRSPTETFSGSSEFPTPGNAASTNGTRSAKASAATTAAKGSILRNALRMSGQRSTGVVGNAREMRYRHKRYKRCAPLKVSVGRTSPAGIRPAVHSVVQRALAVFKGVEPAQELVPVGALDPVHTPVLQQR